MSDVRGRERLSNSRLPQTPSWPKRQLKVHRIAHPPGERWRSLRVRWQQSLSEQRAIRHVPRKEERARCPTS